MIDVGVVVGGGSQWWWVVLLLVVVMGRVWGAGPADRAGGQHVLRPASAVRWWAQCV